MGGRRGRKAVSLVFVASIASAGMLVLTHSVAEAAPPTLTIPGRVYPDAGQIMDFTGTDPISGDSRAIQVSGLVEGAGGCNPTAGNQYDTANCPNFQISLDDAEAGLLRIPGNTAITNLDADPDVDKVINSSGAVITQSTDSHGLDSILFHITGKPADIQETLDKLQFVPCQEQIGTSVTPGPPPNDEPFEIDCGTIDGGDPADEPIYEEKESDDGLLPDVSMTAVQGDGSGNTNGDIFIKIETDNQGPTLTVPVTPLEVPTGQTFDVDDQADVIDPDMCNHTICGDPFADPGMRENDDEMLLVAWIPESSCGTFNFIVSAALTNLGGSSRPTVHDVLRAWTGMTLNDVEQNVAANVIAAAIESTLSPNAVALDLSTQPGSVGSPTTVFAATGDLDEVKFALANIDYNPPADDATCHLNINVSDLGNNGFPTSYVGSPFGPEAPYVGNPSGDDEPYEVPDALADVKSIQFNVKDGHPSVTIDQELPGPLGSPAGPNKPSAFTITFGEPIDPLSFDTSDLTLTTSNAAVPGLGALIPITPGSSYKVFVTASGGDTTLKLQFTGVAYAAGHNGEAAFSTETPTNSDNEIDWDQTGPTVTIDKKVGQPDPTSGTDVVFTVKFSDTISTAPIGFDAPDVDLSLSTTGAGTHVSDVQQPDLLDLKTYEVTVTGMTTAGNVIATVKPNVITDTALNGNQASTSTDNVVAFVNEPVASINDVSMLEGNAGTTLLTFTVSLDQAAVGGESVLVNTSDGAVNGATAGSDYMALVDQPVNFGAGDTQQTVSVTINGDTTFEPDEVFDITLSTPQGLVIGDGAGVGTITNDDVPTFVSIGDVAVAEGDGGLTPAMFMVSLTAPAIGTETVNVALTPASADASDFQLVPMPPVTFAAGQMFNLVNVPVIGDINPEPDETFIATLVAPTGLVIADGTGVGTITNDDIEVSLIPTATIAEGSPGSLTLNISPAVHPSFDVLVSTADITATSFGPDADYIGLSSTVVSVPVDATSVPVPLATLDDNDVEGIENFSVTVTPSAMPPNFTVRVKPGFATGTVTITDNDLPSVVSIGDTAVTEAGGLDNIPISMTNPTGHMCTVMVTSANGSATAPDDFAALVAVQAVLDNVGSTSVPVSVVDDPDIEGTQSFTVTMTVVPDPNCAPGVVSATVLIADDDGPVDNTPPDVTIAKAAAQADPTVNSPVVFDVSFTEEVSGFDASDIQFGAPPTGATLTPTVTGGPQNYQISVVVSGATASGTVQVSIPASAAKDASNNFSNASNTASVAFVVDNVPPDVTSITKAAAQGDPTNEASVDFTVTFSEDVTDLVGTDIDLSTSTTPGTLAAVVSGGPAVYNVSVTGMTGSGLVKAFVKAGAALDIGGNTNAQSATAQVAYDDVAPTVTINQAGAQDPTTTSPIVFNVVFSEDVGDFTTGDVTLGGTAGATTAAVTGTGMNYTVSVSGMTQDGTVIASITIGKAHDGAGNANTASTSIDNTVTFDFDEGDVTPPSVTINQAGAQDPTTTSPIVFNVVFTESVSDFATGDVTLSGTAGATAATVSGSGTTYTVSVSGMTQVGTVVASIAAGVAHDAANNANTPSTSTDNTVTFNSPVINVSTPGGTVTVTVLSGGILSSAGTSQLQVPPPNGVTFPFGQLNFTATGPANGLVTFQLQLPSAVNDYYKLVTNAWQQFAFNGETGAQITNGGTTITVTVKDNGRGDSDPTAGIMTDPAAPAVVAQVPPTTPTTPPTTPTTTPGALPPTGSSSTNNLLVASTLLVGLGLVMLATRRRMAFAARPSGRAPKRSGGGELGR